MNIMKETLSAQYSMVCSSRSALMDYCDTIEPHDFLEAVEGFGRGGSIRNLLVHIGNTYEGWLAKTALERERSLMPYESINSVSECRAYFLGIDTLMGDF